ncbi:UPF0149 family protein [Sphingomonas sp. CFBP 13603]|uniref:UPF0149 family protein n=1 Tax=Sphingomonas sp. CFBP 13603 TaxID=2774040 RepID=UPI001867E7A9|nr:UPF0149 family protein [Sphingomonas sp. CFBP 13603]MBE2993959.1 UPF0149 family protein [Sphingomonas sp. CFBP 13603]
MRHFPSRFRRLDGALADLPLDEPMLLTELDGFLTGIVVGPDRIPPSEWLQGIWGIDDGETAPFEDPADVQWFVDAVTARCTEIVRDLGRGKPQPIFDVDERNGEVLWELWVDGFSEAMALRPDSWAILAAGADHDAADALARLSSLIAIAQDESPLDSIEINVVNDRALADLNDSIVRLYAARIRAGELGSMTPLPPTATKIGRNDPCRCGSGIKSKRCCG